MAIEHAVNKGNKALPEGEKIPHWTPYQIRHTSATAMELEAGLEASQALLDHSSANTTIQPDDIAQKLKQLGMACLIISSQYHMLSKDGCSPRPMFQVYLPLSRYLRDSNKYVRLCERAIRTFHSDPRVKSKAQMMSGYGDNPNAFFLCEEKGYNIDEVWGDDDLDVAIPQSDIQEQSSPTAPLTDTETGVTTPSIDEHSKPRGKSATFTLFASQPLRSGVAFNTSFARTPTEITSENASEFFRYDHTGMIWDYVRPGGIGGVKRERGRNCLRIFFRWKALKFHEKRGSMEVMIGNISPARCRADRVRVCQRFIKPSIEGNLRRIQ